MKEWFNKIFLSEGPIGDKILGVLIGILAILFVGLWAIVILRFILQSIFDFIEWTNRKSDNINYAFEDKINSIMYRIGEVLRLPLNLIPDSVGSFFYYNKTKLKYFKRIVVGISIPIIAVLIWLTSSFSPVYDFLLITKCKTANGYITKAKEGTEFVTTDDNRSSNLVYSFNYDYNFSLPNGKVIETHGIEPGQLPDYLMNLEEPHQVVVEYLACKPKVSRIKGMESNDTSVLQWIRHKMIIQTIIFLCFCYLGYSIVRNGVREYSSARNKVTADEI